MGAADVEHSHEGRLEAARKRGQKLGRPAKLSAESVAMARELIAEPRQTITSLARSFDVSPKTLSRAIHGGIGYEVYQ